MAIISNFELLLKPIAPAGGPAGEIARVAVQGYFLEISNLESRDLKLIFRTRISERQPSDSPNTEFTATNNAVVYDITQDNLLQTSMASAGNLIPNRQLGHYVNCLPLPSGQTAMLAILPNVQSLLPRPGDPAPDLAIRGYTEIVLSSEVTSFSPLSFSQPDSARILVSPEHRGTYVDPQFDPASFAVQANLDFDQTSYGLPTANGRALQVIETYANFNDPFQDLLVNDFGAIGRRAEQVFTLSELGRRLSKKASAPLRATSFMMGNIPVHIKYAIKDGKYVVEAAGIKKALNLMMKRRKLSSDSMPDSEEVAKLINAALGGDKKADAKLDKIVRKLMPVSNHQSKVLQE